MATFSRNDGSEMTLQNPTLVIFICNGVTNPSNDTLYEVPAHDACPLVHIATTREIAGSQCRASSVGKGPEDLPMQQSKAEGCVEALIVATFGTFVGLSLG